MKQLTMTGNDIYDFAKRALAMNEDVYFTAKSFAEGEVIVAVYEGDTFLDLCLRVPRDRCYRYDWYFKHLAETTAYPKNTTGILDRAFLGTAAGEAGRGIKLFKNVTGVLNYVAFEDFKALRDNDSCRDSLAGKPTDEELLDAHGLYLQVYNDILKRGN